MQNCAVSIKNSGSLPAAASVGVSVGVSSDNPVSNALNPESSPTLPPQKYFLKTLIAL